MTPLIRSLGPVFLAAACAAPVSPPDTAPPPTRTEFGGARPATLKVPSGYDHSRPTPLLVVLHGYGVLGSVQVSYFGYDRLAKEKTLLLVAPDGTLDQKQNRFWNATDACCDIYGAGVDDATYLAGLVEEIAGVYNVDRHAIFLAGHSNGGFMSHRLACDRPDLFAAVLSLAGSSWRNAADCRGSGRVGILDVHGDADQVVFYGGSGGGDLLGAYPGEDEVVARWASRNGCTGARADTGDRFDLDGAATGAETRVARYEGCPAGGGVELWTMEGSAHIPGLTGEFAARTWGWLAGQVRP